MVDYSANVYGLGSIIRVFRPRQRTKTPAGIRLANSNGEMAVEHACYLCNQVFFLLPYFSSISFFEQQWALERIKEHHICCQQSHVVFFADMVIRDNSKTIRFEAESERHQSQLLEHYLVRALAYPQFSSEAQFISGSNPDIYLNDIYLGDLNSIISKYESDYKGHLSSGDNGLC